VWSAPAPDRSAASRREAAIKRLSRCDKLTLIAAGDKVPEVGLEV
jgi:predicted GIY-YIG superfamily endonuclease